MRFSENQVLPPILCQFHHWAGIFVNLLLQEKRPIIFGDGTQTRDFTYLDNVIQANLLAAKTPGISGRVYNVASGKSVSVKGMLEKLCELLDVSCEPLFAERRLGDVQHSCADISSIRSDLEFTEQVSFEEGLKKTINDYREVFLTGNSLTTAIKERVSE